MSEKPASYTLSENLFSSFTSFPMTVLLVDDQPIIAEALKKMLADQQDIIFHYCSEAKLALAKAKEIKPTVILQDILMPDINGLQLVKDYRSESITHEIPIIVLSSKEEPRVKAEAFSIGANDYVVKLPDKLEMIARIRYHSNAYIRLLERNEAFKKLEESHQILHDELAEAADYVRSILPQVCKDPFEIDWLFIPSTQLGGDAFGYHWLDERYFSLYLLDVCGHGVGAALHSISVINVLRSRNLPKADFYDPSSVLKALNEAFPMEDHHNLFFSIWYGVYDRLDKKILYSGAGHPPALLLTEKPSDSKKIKELPSRSTMIGIDLKTEFENASCNIADDDRLFLFSDGVYEVQKIDGTLLSFTDFEKLLEKPQGFDLKKILIDIQNLQGKNTFVDDFSLLSIDFKK